MATIREIQDTLQLSPSHYLGGSGLTWKHASGRAKAGSMAGTLTSLGYYRVTIKGKKYLAHHIVALLAGVKDIHKVRSGYKVGSCTWVVDHRDNNSTNNTPSNLQVITHRLNSLKNHPTYKGLL